jgi:hypothetical protein
MRDCRIPAQFSFHSRTRPGIFFWKSYFIRASGKKNLKILPENSRAKFPHGSGKFSLQKCAGHCIIRGLHERIPFSPT